MAQESLKVGDDLYVTMVNVSDLREQDINAQTMQPRHFDRLAENIRQRGQVESLPYCHQPGGEGPIEIISGHHRVRAARHAGILEIPILLDTSMMRRSEVIAKQIAHNELHGSPDEQILAQLVSMIDNVDDLLTTGLDADHLPTLGDDDTNLQLPHAEFGWKTISLLFLDRQSEEFQEAIDTIDKHSQLVGVADMEQWDEFAKQVIAYGRQFNIKSVATTIHAVTRIAAREVEQAEADGVKRGSNWTRTADLIGPQMPPEAAEVVRQAVAKMTDEGDVPKEHPWKALELWAADYLGGA